MITIIEKNYNPHGVTLYIVATGGQILDFRVKYGYYDNNLLIFNLYSYKIVKKIHLTESMVIILQK